MSADPLKMSTHAFASAIFPLPIDQVWSHLRNFTFPSKLLPSIIQSSELESGGERDIGAIRLIRWHSGELRRQRLLSLSDQYYTISWELIEADPPVETSAILSKIRLIRITANNTTLVEWSSEFSSNVPSSFVLFEQRAYQENLGEMREVMTGQTTPLLFHKKEAPSTRVLWLATELGVPLKIKEVVEAPKSLRKSTEMAMTKGGLVTSYVEGHLTVLESGAILMYLLDKHDSQGRLSPAPGTRERALFYKFFFYSASTADHLLFEAYKLMYVDEDEENEELERLKNGWDNDVAANFERELEGKKYICGDQFTAADIMIGWTLFMANLLGWLEGHPELVNYLGRLSRRSAYQTAFGAY
ncbi:hypothetical protein PROFUN_12464 [Planoprotostelium fungivorum]|uniref:Glutathione S-transferase n=1 Tax=Planoprotostelium fungivorum TaxID=1890364 RepID=A0A2P6N7C1_9EUKA|nr:hypothetical protein PROFUN_12464 [Planoprotostelium fungivorum]